MSDVIIKEVDGFDVVQYQPKGVCAKMMQFKIKDNIIHDVEILGGCNGNLRGISIHYVLFGASLLTLSY